MSAVPLPLCGTLLYDAATRLETPHGRFAAHAFRDLAARQPLLVIARGDCRGAAPLLARVHSSCMTGESCGGADCDCAQQLDAALARIAAAGRGAVFYLLQEGRGAGFIAKARDRMLVQASRERVTTFDAYARLGLDGDCRRYEAVAFACAALDITAPLQLLSNNPVKVAALRAAGVAIADAAPPAHAPLAHAPSPFNIRYLTAKSRSGHVFAAAAPPAAAAEPPEAVRVVTPTALPEAPHLLHVASYLLPVRALAPAEGAHWFRLHAWVDRRSGAERLVLTLARDSDAVPLIHVHAETLLGRFPREDRRDPWREALAHLAARGAGAALFLVHNDPALDDPALRPGVAAADVVAGNPDLVRLLAHHLPGRGELLEPHPRLAAALVA